MVEFILNETKVLDGEYKEAVEMVITSKGTQIGTVELSVEQDTCHIHYIGISQEYKRHGYAAKVIRQLNETYTIVGDCLPHDDSIAFWQALGVEFGEDMDECIECAACNPFILS